MCGGEGEGEMGVMTEEVGKAELLAGSGLIRVVCGLVQQNTEVAEKL